MYFLPKWPKPAQSIFSNALRWLDWDIRFFIDSRFLSFMEEMELQQSRRCAYAQSRPARAAIWKIAAALLEPAASGKGSGASMD